MSPAVIAVPQRKVTKSFHTVKTAATWAFIIFKNGIEIIIFVPIPDLKQAGFQVDITALPLECACFYEVCAEYPCGDKGGHNAAICCYGGFIGAVVTIAGVAQAPGVPPPDVAGCFYIVGIHDQDFFRVFFWPDNDVAADGSGDLIGRVADGLLQIAFPGLLFQPFFKTVLQLLETGGQVCPGFSDFQTVIAFPLHVPDGFNNLGLG